MKRHGSAYTRRLQSTLNGQAQPVRARSRTGRNLLLLSTGVVATYAGGSVMALRSEAVHDFFVERVPLGAESVALAESYLEPVPAAPTRRVSQISPRQTVAPDAGQQTSKPPSPARPAPARSPTASPSQAPARPASTPAVPAAVNNAAREASEAVEDLVRRAESALGLGAAGGAARDDALSRPVSRDVKASTTPAAAKVTPSNRTPLPLGFTPAAGQASASDRGDRRDPPTPHNLFEIAPLPRLSPSVASLNGSEPVLGQLAETIDRLSAFLQGAGQLSARDGDAADPAKIVESARGDLTRLATRLDGLKSENTERLQREIDAKSREYQHQLEKQQKELYGKIEEQEDGWRQAFEAERSRMVEAYREKLDTELATQQEIINQRLKEEVVAQGVELQRRWLQEVKTRVEEERSGRLGRLTELKEGLSRLEGLTLDNSRALDDSLSAHKLWSAVRAAAAAVAQGSSALSPALRRVDDAATTIGADALGKVLAPLTTDTIELGSTSASALAAAFHSRVAPKVRRAALLPENAGCLAYFASALLSPLLAARDGATARGNDVASVLARAQYQLDAHNVDGAVRECNQLRGWPKILLRDWLLAARAYLEVQQALEVAGTEAHLRGIEAS